MADVLTQMDTPEVEIAAREEMGIKVSFSDSFDVEMTHGDRVVALPQIEPKYVTFWDFKGNVLAAYNKDEIKDIVYPKPIDYSAEYGVYHCGWSETLEEIRNTKTALDVVARYESETEKIYIEIRNEKDFRISYTNAAKAIPYVIDWGDGSPKEETLQQATHHYKVGSYCIEIIPSKEFDGKRNETRINKECTTDIVAYIANKTKAYANCTPIMCDIPSLTSYNFNAVRWLIHSYFYNRDISNTYAATLYDNVVVNDCKGKVYFSNSYFSGKVLKTPTAFTDAVGFTCVNVRIAEMYVTSNGQIKPLFNCTNAEYYHIHDEDKIDVTKNQSLNFNSWKRIRKITIPDYLRNIPNSFCSNCISLEEIAWNGHEESIGVQAFLYCYHLKDIILPRTIKRIEKQAFTMNAYEKVDIPSGCVFIGNSAFNSGFNNVQKDIYCHIKEPNLCTLEAANVFNTKSTIIHIPKGTMDLYKNATNWSAFANCYVEDLEE